MLYHHQTEFNLIKLIAIVVFKCLMIVHCDFGERKFKKFLYFETVLRTSEIRN